MLMTPHFSKFTLPQVIAFIKAFIQLSEDENGSGNALTLKLL